jgi:hypothetical protein
MRNGVTFWAGIAVCALAAQTAPAAAPGGCAAATKALGIAACVETANGVALADSPAEAAALAEYGRGAEARFEKHFGRKAAPYALVTSAKDADLGALKALGYKATHRWETDSQYDESMLASLKSNIEKMVSERGLSKEQADQFYNQALDRHSQRLQSGERNKTKGGVIPHQIGHASLNHAFWPEADSSGGNPHSGGPAPDWLDEIAAIVVEDDAMSAQRREQFKGGYKASGFDPMTFLLSSAQLVNLGDLLAKPYPSMPVTGTGTGTGGTTMMVMRSGPGGPASPMVEGMSYGLKARMFADYLIERTGRPAIFGNLAAAFSQNQTMEQWLAGEGKTLGLPGDVVGLEADWKAWLLKKLGKPA